MEIVDFLLSWAVGVTPMAITTTLARTASIGVVPRMMMTKLGTSTSIATMVSCTASTTLRRALNLFAASRTRESFVDLRFDDLGDPN